MIANAASLSVQTVPGVGPTYAKRLEKLGIHSVADLLRHVPFRYEDFRGFSRIADIRVGERTSIQGEIIRIATRRTPRRHLALTEAFIRDDTGTIKAVWFNQPYLETTLPVGTRVVLSGRVTSQYSSLEFVSPAYEKASRELLHAGRLVPVYPTTAGITQRQLRYWIASALRLKETLDDPLPSEIVRTEKLLPLPAAIADIHFPSDEKERDRALDRLKFDELFVFQLRRLMDERTRERGRSVRIPFDEKVVRAFVRSLPFTLTASQRAAAWQIVQDCDSELPMNRLLQGDVGSGKTVVAAIAFLGVLHRGGQVSMMAPSEILAEQHFQTLSTLLANSPYPVFLRTRGLRAQSIRGERGDISKQSLADALASGTPALVIGTQALLQRDVSLPELRLVCVDEQHRFGVSQRQEIHKKRSDGVTPHFLSLTATPIPRTLTLALSRDLAVATLKELPKGRQPIRTMVVNPDCRATAYDAVEKECGKGRQAFVVAPLIEPSDRLGIHSATELFEELRQQFPKRTVGLVHGGMKSTEQEAMLHAVKEGRIGILVATAIIEVGIDIPNATVIVIEGAERFGLAQLHQLRGRVGRGTHSSVCFLVGQTLTPLAKKRLAAVATTTDGFALARMDLELRGPGDLVGIEQSGFLDFRFADLGDEHLVLQARSAAERLCEKDPKLAKHSHLRALVKEQAGVHRE